MKLLLVIVIVAVDYYAEKISEKIHFIHEFDSQNTETGRTKFDLKHL